MKNNVLMQVERLTRRHGETRAVDDLNFTLHRGQVLGLLGSNGGGAEADRLPCLVLKVTVQKIAGGVNLAFRFS
jgi:ABC-2 type transport system ATP-binding protein